MSRSLSPIFKVQVAEYAWVMVFRLYSASHDDNIPKKPNLVGFNP
ncbi:MAG: hypothetical protein QM666_01535 [Acinetobacter sp.]